MICQDDRDVERKVIAILRVLSESPEPVGGRIIARRLNDRGIELGERAVRYHLKLMDEKGFTKCAGERDGRLITPRGIEELQSALVGDRVGYILGRMEVLAYLTSFDPETRSGRLPANISLFDQVHFSRALDTMEAAFKAGLCVSHLVRVIRPGEKFGELIVPEDKTGLATVSGAAITGSMLKCGFPLEYRFGGILQMRKSSPVRFTELIEYSGSSLAPVEMFIASRMTSVQAASRYGDGKVLASFHVVPAACRQAIEAVVRKLAAAGIDGIGLISKVNEPACEVPAGFNKFGLILLSGLNPVAAAAESGIMVENHALSGLIEYANLQSFWDLGR